MDELLHSAEQDQQMRISAMQGSPWNEKIDIDNAACLRGLIGKEGWPTISRVGKEASQAAWLIAQHADHDPEFQSHCLELMKALPEGEVNMTNVAYLEDRVRVNQGQPQLFGTQFYQEGDVFGPQPIEDADRLDERRSRVGLVPFRDYEAKMKQLQNTPSSK